METTEPTEIEMETAPGKPGQLDRMTPKEFIVAMAQLGMGTKDFAEATGISKSRISRMRTGKADVPYALGWGLHARLALAAVAVLIEDKIARYQTVELKQRQRGAMNAGYIAMHKWEAMEDLLTEMRALTVEKKQCQS